LNRVGIDGANARQQLLLRRRRERGIQRVRINSHQKPPLLLRDCGRCARRDLERDAQRGRAVVVLRDDAGYAQVADDEKARGGTIVEADIVNGRECTADEFDWHEPAIAAPSHRCRQRDEPAGRRHQRLLGCQHDRLVLVGRGNRARRRIFAHLKLKQRREIVEADHLVTLHVDGGKRAPAIARQDGDRPALRVKPR